MDRPAARSLTDRQFVTENRAMALSDNRGRSRGDDQRQSYRDQRAMWTSSRISRVIPAVSIVSQTTVPVTLGGCSARGDMRVRRWEKYTSVHRDPRRKSPIVAAVDLSSRASSRRSGKIAVRTHARSRSNRRTGSVEPYEKELVGFPRSTSCPARLPRRRAADLDAWGSAFSPSARGYLGANELTAVQRVAFCICRSEHDSHSAFRQRAELGEKPRPSPPSAVAAVAAARKWVNTFCIAFFAPAFSSFAVDTRCARRRGPAVSIFAISRLLFPLPLHEQE